MFKKYMCLALCLIMALCTMSTTVSAAPVAVDGLSATSVSFTNEAGDVIASMPASASTVTASVKVSNASAAAPVILWVGSYVDDVLVDVKYTRQTIASGARDVELSVSMPNVWEEKVTNGNVTYDKNVLKAFVWTSFVSGKAVARPAQLPLADSGVIAFKDGALWSEFNTDTLSYTVYAGMSSGVPSLQFIANDNSTVIEEPSSYIIGNNTVNIITKAGTIDEQQTSYNINVQYEPLRISNLVMGDPAAPTMSAEVRYMGDETFGPGSGLYIDRMNYKATLVGNDLRGLNYFTTTTRDSADTKTLREQNVKPFFTFTANMGCTMYVLFGYALPHYVTAGWTALNTGRYAQLYNDIKNSAPANLPIALVDAQATPIADEPYYLNWHQIQGQTGEPMYTSHSTYCYSKRFEAGELVTIPAQGRAADNVITLVKWDEPPRTDDATLNSIKYRVGEVEYAVPGFVQGSASGTYDVTLPARTTSVEVVPVLKSAGASYEVLPTNPVTMVDRRGSATINTRSMDGTVTEQYTLNFTVELHPSDLPNKVYDLTTASASGVYGRNYGYNDEEYKNTTVGGVAYAGSIGVEDGIVDNVTLAYCDITNVLLNTAGTLVGATIIRSPKADGAGAIKKDALAPYYTVAETSQGIGTSVHMPYYAEGTPVTWISFRVSSDATVYIADRVNKGFPNLSSDWTPITDNSVKINNCPVFAKSFSAGDLVEIPNYGRPAAWGVDQARFDELFANNFEGVTAEEAAILRGACAWDPPMYVIKWAHEAQSMDTTLSALTYSSDGAAPVAVPGFSASDAGKSYNVIVPGGVSEVTIAATANDAAASVAYSPTTAKVTSFPGSVDVTVTAENWDTDTYTVNVSSAAGLSDNAKLSALTYKIGEGTPAAVTGFSAADEGGTYNVSVPFGTGAVTVGATKADSNAADPVYTPAGGSVDMSDGVEKSVEVKVTAEDGITVKTFTVNFSAVLDTSKMYILDETRGAPASSGVTPTTYLIKSEGENTYDYVQGAYTTRAASRTWESISSNSYGYTWSLTNADYEPGVYDVYVKGTSLGSDGSDSFYIVFNETALDGGMAAAGTAFSKTKVSLNWQKASTEKVTIANDGTAFTLRILDRELTFIDKVMLVPEGTAAAAVTAAEAVLDPYIKATFKVDGGTVATINYEACLAGRDIPTQGYVTDSTAVAIPELAVPEKTGMTGAWVPAVLGAANSDYVATYDEPASSNAKLSALTYKVGTETPIAVTGFSAADEGTTTPYEVTLPSGTTSVTIAATKADSDAADPVYNPAGGVVDVSSGSGVATVTVVAEDTTTTNVFTINFTVESADRILDFKYKNSTTTLPPIVTVERGITECYSGATACKVNVDSSSEFEGATLIQRSKADQFAASATALFYTGAYDGVGGNPYWMTFKMGAPGTVYVLDVEGKGWPNKGDWALDTTNLSVGIWSQFTGVGGGLYSKHFNADEIVNIPNYGSNPSWDRTPMKNPSAYIILWDSLIADSTRLKSMTYDDGTGAVAVPDFGPSTAGVQTTYNISITSIPAGGTATIDAAGLAAGATLEFTPASKVVDLTGGSTSATVKVTSADGSSEETYTYNFIVDTTGMAGATTYDVPGRTGTTLEIKVNPEITALRPNTDGNEIKPVDAIAPGSLKAYSDRANWRLLDVGAALDGATAIATPITDVRVTAMEHKPYQPIQDGKEYYRFRASEDGTVFVKYTGAISTYDSDWSWTKVTEPNNGTSASGWVEDMPTEYVHKNNQPYYFNVYQPATTIAAFGTTYYKSFNAGDVVVIPSAKSEATYGQNILTFIQWGTFDRSFDASLSELTYNGISVPNFDGNKLDYTVYTTTATPVTIAASAVDEGTTPVIAKSTLTPSSEGDSTTVVVTTSTGATKTYNVTVKLSTAEDKILNFSTKAKCGVYGTDGYNADPTNETTLGKYAIEDGLAAGRYVYNDRNNVTYSGGASGTSEYFMGATYIRTSKDDAGESGMLKNGTKNKAYYAGPFDGKSGNPYWVEFTVSSGATVYFIDSHSARALADSAPEVKWLNMPTDWQACSPTDDLQIVASSCMAYANNGTLYYKHYNAGEIVQIPNYGVPSAWSDEDVKYDPPAYVIVWDSSKVTPPESGGIEEGGES